MSKKLDLEKGWFGRTSVVAGLCLVFLWFALLLGLVYLRQFTRQTNSPTQIVINNTQVIKDLKEREALATEQLSALEEVVDKTKNSHAREILDMLTTRGVVVVPTENGILIPTGENDDGSIRIIPLISADEKYNVWKKYFQQKSGAMFAPEYRGIVLKHTDRVSAPFTGFTFGHEGDHAFLFLTEARKTVTKEEVCKKERNTYEFEDGLLAGYAGYERYASEESLLAASSLKTIDDMVFFTLNGKYHEELEKIFTPALSKYEKRGREVITRIDIVFRAIDTLYAKGIKNFYGPEDMKRDFICGVYEKNNMLPSV